MDDSDAARFVSAADYCQFETLDADCGADEVVVMETALYGRMRAGRCLSSDYGYTGCSADVIGLADAECSGRRRCSVRVPHEAFASRGECPADMVSYLDATYTCRKGTHACSHRRDLLEWLI